MGRPKIEQNKGIKRLVVESSILVDSSSSTSSYKENSSRLKFISYELHRKYEKATNRCQPTKILPNNESTLYSSSFWQPQIKQNTANYFRLFKDESLVDSEELFCFNFKTY